MFTERDLLDITVIWWMLRCILLVIKSIEATHFTQSDSPKGEFVPGVRYDTQ